ncbi:ModD protein [Neisseriaceae bacterium ESL0693]|nr:ModD protein [Neisseriaceae bacterium ESL0693]
MFYLSDFELDRFLLEDIEYGDLTTRALNIGFQQGQMTFNRRLSGRVSGVAVAQKLLNKLSLEVVVNVRDGMDVVDGATLLTAYGTAEELHQGWKVVQNILEWCCGVAQYTNEMVIAAQRINAGAKIACTRKSIPGTKSLAIGAIIDGGGIIHRTGTAESILLFANHRSFYAEPDDWSGMIATLKHESPEKKIIVEVNSVAEALKALVAKPDIVQLDKFTPAEVKAISDINEKMAYGCLLSVAGGINQSNVADYAKTGIRLLVTSAPYYARPADIKVAINPV